MSVPTELNQDHTALIAAATARRDERGFGECYVSVGTMKSEQGWAPERTTRALKLLEREGMVWRDDRRGAAGKRKRSTGEGGEGGEGGEILFWFPAVFGDGEGDEA